MYSDESKAAFDEYIRLTLENKKRPDIQKDFNLKLEEAIKNYHSIVKETNDLHILLTQYCIWIPECEADINFIQLFYNEYKNNSMKLFKIPENLDPYQFLTKKISLALNSEIYKNYFSEYTSPVNYENFKNLALSSFDELKIRMETITETLPSLDISSFFLTFSKIKIENIAEETKIIESIIEKGKENIPVLKSLLESLEVQESLFSFCNDISASIQVLKLKDPNLTNICNQILKENDQSSDLKVIDFIKKINKLSSELFRGIEHKNKKRMFEFFKQARNSLKLLEFTNSIQQEEIDHLQEGIDDTNHNSVITTELLSQLTNVWSFFSVFKGENQDFSLYCKEIIEKVSTEKYSQLLQNMHDCTNRITVISELYSDLHYQEQAKKKKIELIVNHSTLKFIKKKEYNVELSIIKNNESMPALNIADLIDLKDTAMLSVHLKDSKFDNLEENQKDLELLNSFIRLAETISNILASFESLDKSCYREEIDLNSTFDWIAGNSKNLLELKDKYYQLNNDWEINIKDMQKNCYWLNFMYDKQIYDMENFIFNPSNENKDKVIQIFRFMNKIISQGKESILQKPDELKARLSLMEKIINSYEDTNDSDIFEPGFEQLIKHEARKVLICESKNFYEAVLSIYYNSGRPVPKSDQVMFCNFLTD